MTSEMSADIFARLYIAWLRHDRTSFEHLYALYHKKMEKMACSLSPPCLDAIRIMAQMTHGLRDLMRNRPLSGVRHLKQAATMENEMVQEHGIPIVIKPASELLANVLYQQGSMMEALQYLNISNKYFPNRRAANALFESIERRK